MAFRGDVKPRWVKNNVNLRLSYLINSITCDFLHMTFSGAVDDKLAYLQAITASHDPGVYIDANA